MTEKQESILHHIGDQKAYLEVLKREYINSWPYEVFDKILVKSVGNTKSGELIKTEKEAVIMQKQFVDYLPSKIIYYCSFKGKMPVPVHFDNIIKKIGRVPK